MKRTIRGRFSGVCGVIVQTDDEGIEVRSVEFREEFDQEPADGPAFLTPRQAQRVASALMDAARSASQRP